MQHGLSSAETYDGEIPADITLVILMTVTPIIAILRALVAKRNSETIGMILLAALAIYLHPSSQEAVNRRYLEYKRERASRFGSPELRELLRQAKEGGRIVVKDGKRYVRYGPAPWTPFAKSELEVLAEDGLASPAGEPPASGTAASEPTAGR